MKLLNHVRTIGPAIWLFLLYQVNAELCGDLTWAMVVKENAVADAEAARLLKVSVHTVTRWRRRLEKVSMIKTETFRRGGFKIWVRHSDAPIIQLPSRELDSDQWPEMRTTVVQ